MATCGVCGGGISNTLTPHGAICEDNRKAKPMRYEPEVDDLIKQLEEDNQ